MSFWSSLSFQNLLSSMNSTLETLHDFVMVWLIIITWAVLYLGYKVLKGSVFLLKLESSFLEVMWTVVPILILISIAIPSLHILLMQDNFSFNPKNTLKLISNQWNWNSEQQNETTDHLVDMEKIDLMSSFDAPVILASKEQTRVLLTSSDVLHSLGVPSLGIKLDSIPGRLNAVVFESSFLGVLTGSCYELCGSGHSAMPIYFLMA